MKEEDNYNEQYKLRFNHFSTRLYLNMHFDFRSKRIQMSMTKEQAAEVSRLETEAQAKAAKHVANMLSRPDQLEKVHQLTWRVSRKKASVEAMLKTAMQSQLDGVRTGLNQLEKSLLDISEIKS